MPSNDYMQHQDEEETIDRVSADSPVSSVLPGEQAVGADGVSTHEVSTHKGDIAPLSSDDCTPSEFTFFQKKKCKDQAFLVPSAAHASTAQVTAFVARLDIAVAANSRTHRHVAELMILMSDVARTMTEDLSSPTRKRFCWSKWLFYGCLLSCGVVWFLLFPSGHDLIAQLAIFFLR